MFAASGLQHFEPRDGFLQGHPTVTIGIELPDKLPAAVDQLSVQLRVLRRS
ncbi:MAG: hypothetical protein ACRDSK_24895 [Actinophytocola sp.]|uniref:hypothetical protein n=1 Tax=Actinophytocola sp. TaxID=1872138 RepID=UPI003D6A0F99